MAGALKLAAAPPRRLTVRMERGRMRRQPAAGSPVPSGPCLPRGNSHQRSQDTICFRSSPERISCWGIAYHTFPLGADAVSPRYPSHWSAARPLYLITPMGTRCLANLASLKDRPRAGGQMSH